MYTKPVKRYGQIVGTEIHATVPEGRSPMDKALYEIENELSYSYNNLRDNIRSLVRHLTQTEETLEKNATAHGTADKIFSCINSLGEIQGRGTEIDRLIGSTHALLKAHAALLSASGTTTTMEQEVVR